jgi:hypothetical protein
MSYRSKDQPLDIHIWILCELLIESKIDVKPLQRYITAACFPKISRRMNHDISNSYSNSLENIVESNFPEFRVPDPPKEALNKAKAQNDERLLIEVLPVLDTHIPELNAPNLLRQSKAARDKDPYDIYTKDTRMEFHSLLCKLLKGFKKSLEKLKTYQQVVNRLSEPSEFESYLAAVLTYGTALQLLVRGSAIDKHLMAIEPLLSDHRRDKRADVKLETRGTDKVTVKTAEEEVDVDLEGNIDQPLWKSYRDWLRLMVVHFDAVSILVGHIATLDSQAN